MKETSEGLDEKKKRKSERRKFKTPVKQEGNTGSESDRKEERDERSG